MTTIIQPISSDAYVTESAPSAPHGGVTGLNAVASGTGNTRFSYLYFNRAFPIGATIGPSYLRLYQKGVASGGSRTLTARRITQKWQESTITYANKPTAGSTTAASSAQGNGGVSGRLWEIDISALLQEIADADDIPWYGIRIESNNSTQFNLFSSESDTFQPEVELSWSDAPQTPSVLAPSNGRAVSLARPTLRFDFTDHSGDLTMQGYRLVMNLGGPDEVSPDYDSGDVSASVPEHLVTFDIAAASDWWWAVETIDGAGLHSELSDWVNFTRTAKPTVTIDSPAGFVSESTPPILWSVTGGTQTAYQVFITDPVDTATVLWTSNKVTSTDDSVSVPVRSVPILSPGGTYGLTVRIWDSVTRESTPGDPIYTDESTTFTFDLTTDVDPVTALAVTIVDGEPGATVTWTDATAPDSLTITLDGLTYAEGIDPGDALVSGTSYSWPLGLVKPRVEHEVSVLRVVNGETSDDNPVEQFTTTPEGVWLSTLDGQHSVSLEGTDISFDPSELSVVRKPIGADADPVLITQAVYLPEGEARLNIMAYPGTTLAEAEAEWDAINDREVYPGGTILALTLSNAAKRVFLYNVVKDVLEDETQAKIPVRFSFCERRR